MVDLGGGGDEPNYPDSNGGGDSIRILNSCNDGACQFVEVGHHLPLLIPCLCVL